MFWVVLGIVHSFLSQSESNKLLATKIKNLNHKSNKDMIRFIWTPGHGNIKRNEEAHEAA